MQHNHGVMPRLITVINEKRTSQQDEYAKSMKRALARPPCLNSGGKYPSREQAHDRSGLR
jgi:hypothetical protein